MEVSKEELNNLRKGYKAMTSQLLDRLDNSVTDSENTRREVVYTSDMSVAMLGFGDEGESSEVKNDTFHKTIIPIDGSYEIKYENGLSHSYDNTQESVEIPPMKNFKITSTKDGTVNLIILRRVVITIYFLLTFG